MPSAPTRIKLRRKTQILELEFDSETFELTAEYLRVFSPSAEVKGHGPGQEILQLNKSQVAITGIEPQGNYAIKLRFSDAHDSGIYTWHYLYSLATHYQENWEGYLDKVEEHHKTKDLGVLKWVDPE